MDAVTFNGVLCSRQDTIEEVVFSKKRMFVLSNKRLNDLRHVRQLHRFYLISLVRKCYEQYLMTGKERQGGCSFQVKMRKLTIFTIGGPLVRRKRKRNNINQTLTFGSMVAGNKVVIMCPLQFSAGFAC